jgi:hypothetical protein
VTTPYEAFQAERLEKAALDPLSVAATMGLGHVATNAVIKARNAVGDSISLGGRSFGPQQVVHDAIHDALEGRIAHPAKRELHKLTLGPEVQGQEYALPHALTTEYLRRAGGDKLKALQMMKSTVGTPEFGKGVQGYAPSEHLNAAVAAMDPAKLGPARGGTIAYQPGTAGYAAKETAGKTLARVGAAATGAIDPHLPIMAGLNFVKDIANRRTPIGAAIASRQVAKGMTQGPSTGVARQLTDLIASPGVTQMRDAGAVLGRGIDAAAPASVAADIKTRAAQTLQSPQKLVQVADAVHRTQQQVSQAAANGGGAPVVANAKDFFQHLAPASQGVVTAAGKQVAQQVGKAGIKAIQTPGAQKNIETAYHATVKGYDAGRAAGATGRELGRHVGNELLDATVNSKLPAGVKVRIPSADEVAAGAAAPNPQAQSAAQQPGAFHSLLPVAGGAAAVGAGMALGGGGSRFQEHYQDDPYGQKYAAAMDEELDVHPEHPTQMDILQDAFMSVMENPRGTGISLGRFDQVPQPLRIRAKQVNIAKSISADEALHRVIMSKNHQHHLARKGGPAEREAWIQAFKDRWVGSGGYRLVDMDLADLKHRRFSVDERKVGELMLNPPKDDGNYPIIGRWRGNGNHAHVVLDGNHRVEALLRTGEKRMKAYVQEDLAHELDRKRLGEAETVVAGTGQKVAGSTLHDIFESFSAPIVAILRNAQEDERAEKRAFNVTVPVDLQDHATPSAFPEDTKGHILTSLRANAQGQADLAMILASLRGQEGTPHANAAITHYIAGPHLVGLLRR